MNLLITFAVDPEFAPWPKLRTFQKVAAGDYTLQRTQIGASTVDFIITGMGPTHAERALKAIDFTSYGGVIAAGFAGALVPGLRVSQIVVPKKVRQSTTNNLIDADFTLLAGIVAAGADAIDVLVSSDRIATNAAEKYALTPYGDAVDMESFTVLAAARANRVPAVAIRIISDRHDQAVPVDLSRAIDERGQVSIGSVLKMAAGNPGQVAALMRLGRESKSAAQALAQFLNGFLEKWVVPGHRPAEGGIQQGV